jgi:hypothetical protein
VELALAESVLGDLLQTLDHLVDRH